jgi:hypothetical protein
LFTILLKFFLTNIWRRYCYWWRAVGLCSAFRAIKQKRISVVLHLLWLIDYLLFYVPLKNISLIWRRHHCRWRAAKFRPMLGAQGLWAGKGLYRATPAVTRGLSFSGLIRRTAPFSRLLRHKGVWRIYSNPDPHGAKIVKRYNFTYPFCKTHRPKYISNFSIPFCRRPKLQFIQLFSI